MAIIHNKLSTYMYHRIVTTLSAIKNFNNPFNTNPHGWDYSLNFRRPGADGRDFNQIFRICLSQKDLEWIRFWGVFSKNCCHGNVFSNFSVFDLIGVPHVKPVQRFAPNCQAVFTV